MNVSIVEPHPQTVLQAFRRGEFDPLEVIGQADEKEFFELCFQKKILESLAGGRVSSAPRWLWCRATCMKTPCCGSGSTSLLGRWAGE